MTLLWCESCHRHHAPYRCRHCLQAITTLHPLQQVCDRCQLVCETFRAHGLEPPGRLDEREWWLPLPGSEGEYECSTLGRVKSLDRRIVVNRSDGTQTFRRARGRILMERPDDAGYPAVSIAGRGTVRVHVLVCEAFLGPRPPNQVVLHGNDKKLDNWIGNLSYGSPEDNRADAKRNRVRQTRCRRGHAMTKDTTFIRSDGVRACRTCIDSFASQARSPVPEIDSA